MKCINLHRKFPKLRHTWEPARQKGTSDPWNMLIPCKYGDICPFGAKQLMWEKESGVKIANKLVKAGFETRNEGDTYRSVVFHVDRWKEVAAIVKPRTRRVMTPAQKKAAVARLQKGRDK